MITPWHFVGRWRELVDECDHVAVEAVRSEQDGYYLNELVCVGCGEVVLSSGWLKLWDPWEEE